MTSREFTIYHRAVALMICITMLASYFPKEVWDILFSPAYAAPIATLPLQAPTTPISPLAAANPLGITSPVNEMLQSAKLPEEFEHLSEMGLLTPDGEPNGMLMDLGAMQSAMQQQPASLVNPISISRVQSAYRAADVISNTLLITFTVTNNQRPTITPPTLPLSATITDTMNFVSAIDFENDPNKISNVLLTNDLTNIESFVEASHPADRSGRQLAFNLGHIAPLSSVSVTLSILVPSDVADFTELDSGAKVWGTLQSRMVEAQAYPATLAPNTLSGQPIGEWLKWTVDANFRDEYMLQKAAELGQDPIAMFEYVRSLGYESYKGSLRGTRGTLWSEAGNSLDQASLLIAMLRVSGIPARYRHGTLETAQAQELILSMFPEPTQVIGHVPAGTEVSDPANDSQLLDETQDHWWVEAYIPSLGDWRDLDPSFGYAAVGQRFVPDGSMATDGTDRIAEVPDSLRHKVTMKVKVETYKQITSANGKLIVTYPLTATFSTMELVGKPVTLGHLVNNSADGGLFGWVQHDYIPFFITENNAFLGESYQQLLSNFPFGNVFVTGVWLTFDIHHPSRQVESHSKELFDRIGLALRTEGGTLPLGLEGKELNKIILTPQDTHVIDISVSKIPSLSKEKSSLKIIENSKKIKESRGRLKNIDHENDPDQMVSRRDTRLTLERVNNNLNVYLAKTYAANTSVVLDAFSSSMMTHTYLDSTRLSIVSNVIELGTSDIYTPTLIIDLLKADRKILPYPYQTIHAEFSMRMIGGILEKITESELLNSFTGLDIEITSPFNILKKGK